MATNALPLNKFRAITANLTSGSNIIYQENIDVSTIVLSCQITNLSTGSTKTATVQIQKSGQTGSYVTLLNQGHIPPYESLNPLSGKVVLERNDAFIINTNETGVLDVILSVLENANN
jgi:hypothetical protein